MIGHRSARRLGIDVYFIVASLLGIAVHKSLSHESVTSRIVVGSAALAHDDPYTEREEHVDARRKRVASSPRLMRRQPLNSFASSQLGTLASNGFVHPAEAGTLAVLLALNRSSTRSHGTILHHSAAHHFAHGMDAAAIDATNNDDERQPGTASVQIAEAPWPERSWPKLPPSAPLQTSGSKQRPPHAHPPSVSLQSPALSALAAAVPKHPRKVSRSASVQQISNPTNPPVIAAKMPVQTTPPLQASDAESLELNLNAASKMQQSGFSEEAKQVLDKARTGVDVKKLGAPNSSSQAAIAWKHQWKANPTPLVPSFGIGHFGRLGLGVVMATIVTLQICVFCCLMYMDVWPGRFSSRRSAEKNTESKPNEDGTSAPNSLPQSPDVCESRGMFGVSSPLIRLCAALCGTFRSEEPQSAVPSYRCETCAANGLDISFMTKLELVQHMVKEHRKKEKSEAAAALEATRATERLLQTRKTFSWRIGAARAKAEACRERMWMHPMSGTSATSESTKASSPSTLKPGVAIDSS